MPLPSISRSSAIVPLLLLALAGCDRQVAGNEQASVANALAPEPGVAPAPIDRSHKGEAAPTVAFTDLAGRPVTLAQFSGKPVLVNLWATWCAPCVKEMPTLDAAAKDITVVAISQDLDGAAKVEPYLAKAKLTNIKPYLDTKTVMSVGYNASLPTSILYDAKGHEVWRSSGGMDWTSAPARALLAEGSAA